MRVRFRRRAIAALVVLPWIVPGAGGGASAQEVVDKGPSEAEVTAPERMQPRIVGGTIAPTGAYPWHVALDFGLGPSQCGGTLVSSRWVMTAAHCVDGLTPNRLTLIIGRSVLSDTSQGEVRQADQILVHPSYDEFTSEFDAALVRLDAPATRRWARPALPGDPFLPGDVLRAIGHGATCEGCSRSDALRQVDLPVQSDSTMEDLYGSDFDPPTMLGAGPVEGGKDTCQGDSGGPLFVAGDLQPAVAGITSWGFGCARPDSPGVYTEVAASGIRSFLAANVPRPANDDFAAAQAVSGASGQVAGANTDATGQVDEPAHAASAADTTVWYSWTAPSAAPVSFAVTGASFDSALAVYTGTSVTGLNLVAANDDADPNAGLDPRVTFTPASGATYRIAVDGVTAAWGPFQLQWGPPATGPDAALSDFTGDGRADPTVYRPGAGHWFVNGGTPGFAAWGTQGDIPVPADYTGDGRADVAVFRPSTGTWFVQGANPGSVVWGTQGDVPVPADYTGDGRADVAVFRPSTGTWFVQGANPGSVVWGTQGDVPVPADYTGDGRADVAVFRPSTGQWFVQGGNPSFVAWGTEGDVPVPADYTGDGRADVAVFRPSTGTWFVQGASPGAAAWGTQGDVPVPADYTGDGRADVAVFRPSTGTWFFQGATPGFLAWGTQGDVPVVLPGAVYEPFF